MCISEWIWAIKVTERTNLSIFGLFCAGVAPKVVKTLSSYNSEWEIIPKK